MIDFALPLGRDATKPAEERGLARDEVRLLVAEEHVTHATFRDLPQFLGAGDVLVVNDSATLPSALDAVRVDGRRATVHFGSDLGNNSWAVELRPPGLAKGPVQDASVGERVMLRGGGLLTLAGRFPETDAPRFWQAYVDVGGAVPAYLHRFGRPITYSYVDGHPGLAAYQTVFARRPGSAEMPSAGRPFTAELVVDLVTAGIVLAPLTLHAGLSSAEAGEPPAPEPYRVPAPTAQLVNFAREHGHRVVAVGTTVVRALETLAGSDGRVDPGEGWTNLVLGPDRPARAVDGLVTGWHPPGASHLDLLEAVVGRDRVACAYQEAVREGYLWHEFGDSALLLR